LLKNIFEKGGETIHVTEPEKALDVASEKGIHPLAEEGRFFSSANSAGGRPPWNRRRSRVDPKDFNSSSRTEAKDVNTGVLFVGR
jgi:hypothetical protein